MKKLALLIAALLVVFAMCACKPADSGDTSKDTGKSSSAAATTASSEATTTASSATTTTTTAAPASTGTTNPPAAAGELVRFDNASYVDGTVGIFTITGGKFTTTGGKTCNTVNPPIKFTVGGIQLGNGGSTANKVIKFTAASAGTLLLYTNTGSNNVGTTFAVVNAADASVIKEIAHPDGNIQCHEVAIAAAGEYAIYHTAATGSTNVWGAQFNAAA